MADAIRNNSPLLSSDVILCMSEEEASTLHTIFQFIGGNPDKSRRKHVDDMRKALRDIDVECDTSDIEDRTSAINFVTKPVKPSFNVGDVVEIVDSEGFKAEYLQCGNVGEVLGFDCGYVLVGIYKSKDPAHEWYFKSSSLKLLRKAKG